ncbi:hypothetical protein HBI24_090470 [Parastagonospora nodorum]|nr:hypothetical protein HBI24_090470 [Parastagonospora nodorum]
MDWHVHREQTCSNIKSQLPIPGAEPDTQTDGQSDQHDHGDPHNRGRRADLVDVFVRNNPALNVSDLDCSQPLIDSYGAFYQYPKYLDFADYQAMHDHHLPDLF